MEGICRGRSVWLVSNEMNWDARETDQLTARVEGAGGYSAVEFLLWIGFKAKGISKVMWWSLEPLSFGRCIC